MSPLAKLLEAALFASARPVPTEELSVLDPEATPAALQAALDELREHYNNDGHGVELADIAGGWQILTRPEYTETIERAQLALRPTRLSSPSLETLFPAHWDPKLRIPRGQVVAAASIVSPKY